MAGSKGKTKPVRVQENLLAGVRSRMLEHLEPRLKKVLKPNGGYKHADPNFVYFVGPDLAKISDSEIVTHALMLLDVQMRGKPIGECGIPFIDGITPGDHLGDRPDNAE